MLMVFYQKEAAEIKHVIAQRIEIYAQIQVFANGNMVPESLWHFFSISHQEKKILQIPLMGIYTGGFIRLFS